MRLVMILATYASVPLAAAQPTCRGLDLVVRRPEYFSAATLVSAEPLHPEIIRRAHVPSGAAARRPHQVIELKDMRTFRINPLSSLAPDVWGHLIRMMTGVPGPASPVFMSVVDHMKGALLTLRTPYPRYNVAPIAGLRLGHQLYTLELRSPRGTNPTLHSPIFAVNNPGPPAWLAIENAGARPLPGSATSRGSFMARLVAEYSPDDELEIVLDASLRDVAVLDGTWLFDHDFFTLRILLTPQQIELFRGREAR